MRDALAVLPRFADDLEVTVIDDGSTDRTGKIADDLAKADPRVRVVHHGKRRGYGGAVRSGLVSATKEFVFFTDGDRQFALTDLERLIDRIDGVDAVMGYRLKRQDPARARFVAFVYNNLIRVHLHTSAGDTDVTGTLGHKGPMIAAINDVWIDIPVREGWLLLVDNRDRPGTVGALGVLLGKHGINITSMEVESIEGQDQALMAVTVDREIDESVLREIGAISNILATRLARFS